MASVNTTIPTGTLPTTTTITPPLPTTTHTTAPPPPPPPPSTTTSTSSTSSSTSSSSTSTSSTSTTEPPSTTTTHSSVVTAVTTETPTRPATTIVITSTAPLPTTAPNTSINSSTSTTTTAATAPASTHSGSSSGGLSASGTIAVAVVVPVVGVALLILLLLWLWRRRKARKLAEEERRKEVEEYGYNPNNDPTLPAVGLVGAYGDGYQPKEDGSGYRGWGSTSAGRKLSTNLSGAPPGVAGIAMSESGSGPGFHHGPSPSDGTIHYNDAPYVDEAEPIGVLGGAAAAGGYAARPSDIRRGPSNASSAYSAANRSDASEESHMAGAHPAAHEYDENAIYGDMQPPFGGAYGEGPYDAPQPVIRDVQARRNTQIENPGVYPRHGNAGIAQNF